MPRTPGNVDAKVFEAGKAFGLALAGGDRFPNPIVDWQGFQFRHHPFWHRVNITAIVANQDVTFFNVASTPFVTNLPQAKSIGGNSLFFLTAPRFVIERGYQVDGTAVAAADFAQFGTAAFDADPNNVTGDIATIYQHGLLNLRVGGEDVVKDQYGLYNFPAGGGPVIEGMQSQCGTAGAAGGGIANCSNGVAIASNKWEMAPYQWIGPNDQIECAFKFNFARTLAATIVGRFILDGYLVGTN